MDYKSLTNSQLKNIFNNISFITSPMRHQLISLAWATNLNRIALPHGIGTGKTLTALYINIYIWQPKRILVVCPSSVIQSWEEQTTKHTNLKFFSLVGKTEERKEKLMKEDVDIFFINYEGLQYIFGARISKPTMPPDIKDFHLFPPGEERAAMFESYLDTLKVKKRPLVLEYVCTKQGFEDLYKFSPRTQIHFAIKEKTTKTNFSLDINLIKDVNIDSLIIDECHHVKTSNAIQTKICREISKLAKNCIIMSGSPGNEIDMWSQYYVLNGGLTLGTNYYSYLNNYFRKEWHNWIITQPGRDRILQKVSSCSLRFEREECFDLPEEINEYRYINFSPEQKKITNDIIKGLQVELNEGVLTPQNIQTRSQKLLQITSGFVIGTEGVSRLKTNPKLDELNFLLDEITCKVIIFHHYEEEGRMIENLLQKKHINFASLRGEITNKDKQQKKFKEDISCKVLVAHPKSGGEGLNFQCSNVIIFFHTWSSPDIFDQAVGRIMRKGQDKKCLLIHLMIKDSIEEVRKISRENKADENQYLLDYIRDYKPVI